MKRYIYLLKLALIEACVVVRDAQTSVPVLFASRIIALCCTCIPAVSEVVYSALLELQPKPTLPLPDLRYDIFNVDEDDYNVPVLQTKLSSPIAHYDASDDDSSFAESSLPRSHTMYFFPSETPSSLVSPSFEEEWVEDETSGDSDDSNDEDSEEESSSESDESTTESTAESVEESVVESVVELESADSEETESDYHGSSSSSC